MTMALRKVALATALSRFNITPKVVAALPAADAPPEPIRAIHARVGCGAAGTTGTVLRLLAREGYAVSDLVPGSRRVVQVRRFRRAPVFPPLLSTNAGEGEV